MQQLNIKFLNLPEPASDSLFVEKATRALALARAWACEARAAGLSDLLPVAAASDLRALLARIDAREVLEPDAGILAAATLAACGAALGTHRPEVDSRRRSLEVIRAQRDALLPVAAALDGALDLAAALAKSRSLGRS